MSNKVEFQLNDFVQVGNSGRKGKIVRYAIKTTQQ